MDISEKNFEASIEATLLAGGPDGPANYSGAARESGIPYGEFAPGGYYRRQSTDYDRALCLIPKDLFNFILATQPKEWAKLQQQLAADAKARLLQRLDHEIRQRGTLHVLRKGIRLNGCRFALTSFRPASGLNPALRKLYEANLFSVVRQLKYSQKTEQSLDVVLFLNGLPIFTAELKNPLTGQNVQDAIRQYLTTRDPREQIFAFGRCLAHFAVDPDLVYMTTHLQGPKTEFLPFNQGRGTGAGNPPALNGFATAYLWERVWSRDSVLDLIQNFIQMVDELDDNGNKIGKRKLIFPRYHQLDAVRRLIADARASGPGRRYLIQHSAGSGKSNSIAWLAHQLASLHDAADQAVFDSIVVITDRRILDKQIQATMLQFEQTPGVVENIDTTSRQLKAALEDGKKIVVTTLQKFPVIANEIETLPGKRFAVIIDEAHSSQSGESTKSLRAVLAAESLEEAERDESGAEDPEDRIIAEMKHRGPSPNVSYFAFTATPKATTLELFGARRPDGKYEPFSLYSMRQAIEERFILDVLENYTTYKTYFSLLKKIADDPRYERRKAMALLRSFVDLHEHAITKKVALMVEHFTQHTAHRIGGKAKAMVVTRSRLHAVRYKQAFDVYLKKKGYPHKALVAFSGTVRDGGLEYTEAGMNGLPEKQTAETFKKDEYRFLIVANKFQTGFDQPLLHTMYVDKKLGGVSAVQTLSRLNRVHPDKNETMVLDFANEAEQIQEAFEPYYDRALLKEGTDPNLLYDLQTRLSDFHFYDGSEVNTFAATFFNPKATQAKLHALLTPVVDRYQAAPEDEQLAFRSQLAEYVRLYAFLSQILTFVDADLERLYVFARLLLRKLPVTRDQLPIEIQQNIDMESYRIQKTSSGRIRLERGTMELEPASAKGPAAAGSDDVEALSKIIEQLNQRFGTDFTEDDKVFIQHLETRLAANTALENSVRVNSPDNARLTFDHVAIDEVQEMMETNFRFYKQINDDKEFAQFFFEWLFERYCQKTQTELVEQRRR